MHIVLNINFVMSIYAGMVVFKRKLKFNNSFVYVCLAHTYKCESNCFRSKTLRN